MSTCTAHRGTILIVDDDEDMRFLARAVFEGSSTAVAAEAVDGLDALRVFDELNPPPVPTVVLLDNQMPGLSGLEVAARILAERPEQLIVLFSAFLDPQVEAEAARIGVTKCVSKSEALQLPQIIDALLDEHA